MSNFKTKKEKHDAMQTAYWLDEDLKYHASAALRATAETLLETLYAVSGGLSLEKYGHTRVQTH